MTVKSSPKHRCPPSAPGQIFDLWLARYIENGNVISEEEKIELLYRYSREIEHSDENLKMIEEIMAGHKVPWLHNRVESK